LIKVSVTSNFNEALLKKAIMAAAEKSLKDRIQKTTQNSGGVKISAQKASDGTLKSFRLSGSVNAIEAAKKSFR
jgi:hypothetical protein